MYHCLTYTHPLALLDPRPLDCWAGGAERLLLLLLVFVAAGAELAEVAVAAPLLGALAGAGLSASL